MSDDDVLLVIAGASPHPEIATALGHLAGLGATVHLVGPTSTTVPAGVHAHRLPPIRPTTMLARLTRRLRWADDDAVGRNLMDLIARASEIIALDTDANSSALTHHIDATPIPHSVALERLTAIIGNHEIFVLRQVDNLVRARRHDKARVLIAGLAPAPGSLVAATLRVLTACMDLSDQGHTEADLHELASAALALTDQRWAQHHHEAALYALSAVVRMLFHPVLHSEVAEPPLLRDADTFLAPLRSSQMFQDLIGPPTAAAPAAHRAAHVPEAPTRVLVLTGSYPRFAEPLLTALGDHPDITVQALSLGEQDKMLCWLGANTQALALRLPVAARPRALRSRPRVDPAVFAEADVVIADWADRGAMWASMTVPPGTRLVVRLHGADVLSPWAQFIDWDRVDDAVFVSAPLRDMARTVLGARLDRTRVHVIEHGVDSRPFDHPPDPQRARTLGMIGWGRVVKDPLWTLEVLAELINEDPTWRLLLVGHSLDRDTDHRARAYRAELDQRLQGPLDGHVEIVDQTDDVPTQAARMGFIISASLRESFHLGLVEGVLAGAVPVVRNWPAHRGGTGPRGLFPSHWVVDDVPEAASRIRHLADEDAWHRAAQDAQAHARQVFSNDRFDHRIQQLIRP